MAASATTTHRSEGGNEGCETCGVEHAAGECHVFTYCRDEKIDEDLIDPITLEPLVDPVFLSSCRHSFSRTSITGSLAKRSTCPMCNAPATTADFLCFPLILKSQLDKLKV